jgi:hypothetical protein
MGQEKGFFRLGKFVKKGLTRVNIEPSLRSHKGEAPCVSLEHLHGKLPFSMGLSHLFLIQPGNNLK